MSNVQDKPETTGPTKVRHVRVADPIWDAAFANAQADGYTGISELVRDLLRDYNAGKRMAEPR